MLMVLVKCTHSPVCIIWGGSVGLLVLLVPSAQRFLGSSIFLAQRLDSLFGGGQSLLHRSGCVIVLSVNTLYLYKRSVSEAGTVLMTKAKETDGPENHNGKELGTHTGTAALFPMLLFLFGIPYLVKSD